MTIEKQTAALAPAPIQAYPVSSIDIPHATSYPRKISREMS